MDTGHSHLFHRLMVSKPFLLARHWATAMACAGKAGIVQLNKIKKGTWGTPSFKGASEQERKKQSIKDQKKGEGGINYWPGERNKRLEK